MLEDIDRGRKDCVAGTRVIPIGVWLLVVLAGLTSGCRDPDEAPERVLFEVQNTDKEYKITSGGVVVANTGEKIPLDDLGGISGFLSYRHISDDTSCIYRGTDERIVFIDGELPVDIKVLNVSYRSASNLTIYHLRTAPRTQSPETDR